MLVGTDDPKSHLFQALKGLREIRDFGDGNMFQAAGSDLRDCSREANGTSPGHDYPADTKRGSGADNGAQVTWVLYSIQYDKRGNGVLGHDLRGELIKTQSSRRRHERYNALMRCGAGHLRQAYRRNGFDRGFSHSRECHDLAQTFTLLALGDPDGVDPARSMAQSFFNRINPAQHIASPALAGGSRRSTGIRGKIMVTHELTGIRNDETHGVHRDPFPTTQRTEAFGGFHFDTNGASVGREQIR